MIGSVYKKNASTLGSVLALRVTSSFVKCYSTLEMTSPPLAVPKDPHTPYGDGPPALGIGVAKLPESMLSLTKRTEPSHIEAFTPPVW